MDNLALKLVLTPALIGTATLAGRRWGQSVGGWLVGLPLTTGPVAFFIALDHGTAFAVAAAILQPLDLGPAALFALVVAALALSLRLMPAATARETLAVPPPWDLPARMVLATAVVLALTALAPRLGARWSGLLATYPLFAAILTAFGHHVQGAVTV